MRCKYFRSISLIAYVLLKVVSVKKHRQNSDVAFFSTTNDALKQKWLSASPFGWKIHKNHHLF